MQTLLLAPLLTLMASPSPELAYALLKHIELLVSRVPGVFADDYGHFYTRYNEPSHVKYATESSRMMLLASRCTRDAPGARQVCQDHVALDGRVRQLNGRDHARACRIRR